MAIAAIGNAWKLSNRTGSLSDRDVRLYADFRQFEYPDLGTGSARYTFARESNLIDRGNCEFPIAPYVDDGGAVPSSDCTPVRSGDFSHTGDYSYKCTKSASGVDFWYWTTADTGNTKFNAGQKIEVSFWMYLPTGEADASDLFLLVREVDDASANQDTNYFISSNGTPVNDAWFEVSFTHTMRTDHQTCGLLLRCNETPTVAGDLWYVDDIRITTHNIPGSHYLSNGYTEQLLEMPDTFTRQTKFIATFAYDTGSNQPLWGWQVSATQRLWVYYSTADDKFYLAWNDDGTERVLASAQYDDGSSFRNINQEITLTVAVDLTTGDTTGSAIWLNKTQDDTAWNDSISAKTTVFNLQQTRADGAGSVGAYNIIYDRFFSGMVATDAQVQADYKDVKNEEIYFSLDGHGTGRTRCNISVDSDRRLDHYDLYKGVTSKYNGSFGTNSFNFRLRNDDGAFSDDQDAAWDPANSVYNGTNAQNYLTQRFGVICESWYSGDFDYIFVGRATEDGLRRSSKMSTISTVECTAEDGVGDLDRSFEEFGRIFPGNMLTRQDTMMDRGGCESLTPPAMIGEESNTLSNATFVRTDADIYHGRYSYIGTKTIAAGTAATITLADSVGAGDLHGFVAGATYTWVIKLKLPSGAMLGSEFVIAIVDSVGSTTQAAANTYDVYQEVSVTRTIDAGATYAYPQIQLASAAADTELFYIDQIKMIPADQSEATGNSLFHLIAKRGYRRQIQFLSNNSFENADITKSYLVTTGGAFTKDAADGFFGSASGELIPGAAAEQGYQIVSFTGSKKLNVGEKYNFSALVKSVGAASGANNFVAIYEQTGAVLNDSTSVAYTLAGGEDYKQADVTHTITNPDSTLLLALVGGDAGDTINTDGWSLIQSDRALDYFEENTLDGTAGQSLADLGDEISYPWFGIHTGNVDYIHPWRRMEINTTVWLNLKSVGAGAGARYCGCDESGTVINRGILDNEYSDLVPAGVVTENYADLNHVLHAGITVTLDSLQANRIYGHGNKHEISTIERLIWLASATGSFTDYDGDQQLSETVLNGAYWPNPDVYNEFWAEYGVNPDFSVDNELTIFPFNPLVPRFDSGGKPLPFVQLYVWADEVKKVPASKRDRIVGIQDASLIHKLSDTGDGDGAFTYVTAGRLVSGLDITSRAGQAQPLLLNATGVTKTLVDAGIVGKPVYKFSGAEGWIHDSYIDRADIAKNGERLLEFGGEDVIDGTPNGQLDRLADFIWKDRATRKHIYSPSSTGALHDIGPSEWMLLDIGAAGETENILSTAEAVSIRITADADVRGKTQITYRELTEGWKYDSNAAARFFARGVPIAGPAAGAVVTVASEFNTGGDTAYRISQGDTSAQVTINKAIDYISGAYGGGTVRLTKGVFNIDGAIVLKNNVVLSGDGDQTIIDNVAIGATYSINITSVSGARVEKLKLIEQTSVTALAHINLDTSTDCLIQKVFFEDSQTEAIRIDDCGTLTFNDINIIGFKNYGVHCTGVGSDSLSFYNMFIDGESRGAQTAALEAIGDDIKIINCTVRNIDSNGSATGILASSSTLSMSNIYIANIDGASGVTSSRGIYLGTGSDGAKLSNIEIYDVDNSDTASLSSGIEILSDNCVISNIRVSACSGTGILITATADKTQISSGRSTGNGTDLTDSGTLSTYSVEDT